MRATRAVLCRPLCVTLAWVFLCASDAAVGDWACEKKLVAPNEHARDGFGSAVAIRGDRLIVGVPREDCPNGSPEEDCGAAYIFRFNGATWVVEARLSEPPGHGLSA